MIYKKGVNFMKLRPGYVLLGVLISLIIIAILLFITVRPDKLKEKAIFESNAKDIVHRAKLYASMYTPISSDKREYVVFGFGNEQTENHTLLDTDIEFDDLQAGKVIILKDGTIEATFYSKNLCATYNHTTGEIEVKEYDSTCILPSLKEETLVPETEISLDSDTVKYLTYPYEIYTIPASNRKLELYALDSYTINHFPMETRLGQAFDYYNFEVYKVYDKWINEVPKTNISKDYSRITVNPVTKEDIKKAFSYYWGPDTEFQLLSFKTDFTTEATCNTENCSLTLPYGIGGAAIGNYKTVVNIPFKATTQGEKLYIYEYVGFESHNVETGSQFYYDIEHKNIIKDITAQEQLINHSENLKQYRYTFKKHSDGKYYFEKGEWL